MPPDEYGDAWAEALGEVLAETQRQFDRDREIVAAEYRAALAELRAEMAERMGAIDRAVLALRDGKDGAAGRDGAEGKEGAQGPQGERGEPGPPGERGERGLTGDAGAVGPRGERGEQGKPGPAGERGEAGLPGEAGAVGLQGPQGAPGEPGPQGQPGEKGAPGEPGRAGEAGPVGPDGERGEQGARGAKGEPGEPGARGEPGPAGKDGADGKPGKLPVVKAWVDCVHYEGNVVRSGGSLWQASKDTGQMPGGADWLCLAARGHDGKSPQVRGVFDENAEYHWLDIVSLGGGSFMARRDSPGACPGDGWQLLASQGKHGKPGERGAPGERGLRGEQGAPAPIIKGWKLDRECYIAVPIMSDGKDGPPLDLRGLFESYHRESSG